MTIQFFSSVQKFIQELVLGNYIQLLKRITPKTRSKTINLVSPTIKLCAKLY